MAGRRFHGLKKAKIRASWNKFNLYNLSRWRSPLHPQSTFYQQKWKSKSVTRAYHGEMIREKQWQRMFTSKLDAVIPMDHRYLAEHDGSELAEGRGSGKELDLTAPGVNGPRKVLPVPYMNMTYAPIERRLDMAIFRALFASSARQARQLVVHGHVKVNGQKMPYPGYLLNPGDMYQVDIDSVMFSTGAIKPPTQRADGRALLRRQKALNRNAEEMRQAGAQKRKARLLQAAAEGKEVTKRKRGVQLHDSPVERGAIKRELEVVVEQIQLALSKIKNRGRWKIMKKSTALRWKRKGKTPPRRRVINFMRLVNDTIRATYRIPMLELEEKRTDLNRKWLRIEADLPKEVKKPDRNVAIDKNRVELRRKRKLVEEEIATERKIDLAQLPKEQRVEERKKIRTEPVVREKTLSVLDQSSNAFRAALARARENPLDEEKPYATPWEPRAYMSAFAFIPRYLEVNHAICSAVYLRHPVVRPGLAEVPSPFPADELQLAFNWYLRRR